MNIEAEKLSLIELVLQLRDQAMIEQLRQWLGELQTQQAGAPLPILSADELVAAVDEAKEAVARGETVPHEQVRNLVLKKLRG